MFLFLFCSNVAVSLDSSINLDDSVGPTPLPQDSWWQCRFCDESFNASKKLTIHMNSHEEYDNKETTCKDCGNTYGTRKSLWVHRQKKHPRIPNPSPCALCEKIFFDKTELMHHLKTHSNDDVFSHLQEMQEQLEAEQENRQKQQKLQDAEGQGAIELSCHICHQRFHDKRVLSKHLRIHEQQKQSESLFGNSPLAAMLADTTMSMEENGSTDYSYPSYKGQMVDGQYACDMCPKTFPLMTALKVHRGWHFRSPDGRQITDSNNIWHPDSTPAGSRKRARQQNPPVCPYCKSTFASGNNLRRHIVEVHKRNEAKMMRENGTVGDNVFIEKECECHACSQTFESRAAWVEHKIGHARTMKPSTTFEWGCEICGKIFTRKERLLVHMLVHLNGKEEDASQNSNDQQHDYESNSQSSVSSHSPSQQSQESNKTQISKTAAPKAGMSLLKQPSLLKQQLSLPQQQKMQQSPPQESNQDQESQQRKEDEDVEEEQEEEEEEENVDDDMEREDSDREEESDNTDAAYSCDLCQVYFRTSKELRRHVTSHFLPVISVPAEKSPEKTNVQKSVEPASAINLDDDNIGVDDIIEESIDGEDLEQEDDDMGDDDMGDDDMGDDDIEESVVGEEDISVNGDEDRVDNDRDRDTNF